MIKKSIYDHLNKDKIYENNLTTNSQNHNVSQQSNKTLLKTNKKTFFIPTSMLKSKQKSKNKLSLLTNYGQTTQPNLLSSNTFFVKNSTIMTNSNSIKKKSIIGGFKDNINN